MFCGKLLFVDVPIVPEADSIGGSMKLARKSDGTILLVFLSIGFSPRQKTHSI